MKEFGIGLRHQHFKDILEQKPNIGWLEVHSENFFAAGGVNLSYLEQIAEIYPLSLHGVSLSLGSADGIKKTHLKKLKNLIDKFNPILISEHLSWSQFNGNYYHDLLPIPYSLESLKIVSDNISYVQDYLGKEILIENPSSYLSFKENDFDEVDFLNQLTKKTGCKILFDINNIYVTSKNIKFDTEKYLQEIHIDAVKEIHLAGPEDSIVAGKNVVIDTHNNPVRDEVWELYEKFISQSNTNIPTLIEWDNNIPSLQTLINEADKAYNICRKQNAA